MCLLRSGLPAFLSALLPCFFTPASRSSSCPAPCSCVKPNPESRPGNLVPEYVLEQLRAGGVLEAVRIACAGGPGHWAGLTSALSFGPRQGSDGSNTGHMLVFRLPANGHLVGGRRQAKQCALQGSFRPAGTIPGWSIFSRCASASLLQATPPASPSCHLHSATPSCYPMHPPTFGCSARAAQAATAAAAAQAAPCPSPAPDSSTGSPWTKARWVAGRTGNSQRDQQSRAGTPAPGWCRRGHQGD